MGASLGRISRKDRKKSSDEISFQDYLGLCNVMYEWAAAYDTKDWNRLKKVLAPTVRVCSPEACTAMFGETS